MFLCNKHVLFNDFVSKTDKLVAICSTLIPCVSCCSNQKPTLVKKSAILFLSIPKRLDTQKNDLKI